MRRATLALVLLVACGRPAPTAPSAPGSPAAASARGLSAAAALAAGERMDYRLSLEGIELATFGLTVGADAELDGRRAVVVQSQARASSLVAALGQAIDDRFTSWLDPTSGRPLRFEANEASTKKKGTMEHVVARLGGCADRVVPLTYGEGDAPPASEPQRLRACDDVWDLNSFLLALRGWEGTVGASVETEVFRSRYLWRARVTIAGRERRVTRLGELPTLRIDGLLQRLTRDGAPDPEATDRRFSLWISDEADRVPVALSARTDYGNIKMDLVDYQPGAGRAD